MSKYSDNMPPDLKTAIGWMYDFIKPGSDFLDFGCSTGYFGSLIKAGLDCKVYGVEISDDVKEARKVLDGVYSFDLDGTWPAKVFERKYDYVFFGDVLEHLKQPGVALEKCKKLLKKGGKIFVSVPNIAHMSIRLELIQGNFEYESMGILDSTHLQYFTLDSFARMANGAGYKVERVDYSFDDFPTEITTKILEKVGLKPTKAFWKEADTVEARAHQYKFILAPSTKPVKQKDLPVRPLPTKPEQERDAYVKDLQRQAKAFHEHANEQAKIIDHYVNRSKELEQVVEQLEIAQRTIRQKLGSSIKRHLTRKKD